MTDRSSERKAKPAGFRRRFPQRKHLRRLETIHSRWRTPVFFITVCTQRRRACLSNASSAAILVEAFREAEQQHGWSVGRYVVMPDHVHFFCTPCADEAKTLSRFVGFWKRGTAATIRGSCLPDFAWQAEFFDHLMRSGESYEQKWERVRANPVRAGLVDTPEEWPFQGEVSELRW